ncbi:MAG: hypothetical protein BGN87_03920 [Rhizobiales bacterium 65-79]|jgi:hypothetical protein|nr:hypothetical protein [Hyphomicrobiales bacterium]OJU04918.1 MAG: hypothetical protein BGN87_03920 [Rhizobiales bacterium 65-79]
MNRILSIFIALHWTMVFAALAALAGLHGGENFSAVLAAVGIGFAAVTLPMPVPAALCGLLAIGFGIVAALFLWTFVTALLDRGHGNEVDEVARLAFGSAVAVLTAVFLGCVLMPAASGLYRSMALELGALLASYLAVCAERRATAAKGRAGDPIDAAARAMALRAAHESLVHRLMGRGRSGEPR